MTLKDAHKRASRALNSASSEDENMHYYLLTGEVKGQNIDMGAAMSASPEVLAEMLLTSMRESSETAFAVLAAAHQYAEDYYANEQEVN